MDNSKTSQTSKNSNEPINPSNRKDRQEVTIPLDTRQGGKTVLLVKGDEMKTTNDPSACEHNWVLDPTEDLGTAYMCTKPMCGLIRIQSVNERKK